MDKLEKVAVPETALTVVVPLRVPPPGFVPIARVMEALLLVTMFPPASSTCTVTAGLMFAPATAFVGCCTNTSCVAVPAVMLNALLVALVSPVEVAANV